MDTIDSYNTIKETSEGLFKDRGSKFYSFAFPVSSEDEVHLHRSQLRKKYHDARHHVYAFRLGYDGNTFRSSDDGEPTNSSGPPVLGQIRSFDLSNILIVVIRYFGGTKLGIPGLINAYKSAAYNAITNAEIIEKKIELNLYFTFDYSAMNVVMHLIKKFKAKIDHQNFQQNCEIKITIERKNYKSLKDQLSLINSINFSNKIN